MQVVTTRVDEQDAKALADVERAEKSDRSVVVRKLLAMGLRQWKLEFALTKLRNREISIRKAAAISGISYADMLDAMTRMNIDIGYTSKDLESDIERLKK